MNLKLHRVAQITQFNLLAVLAAKYIGSFQIAMHYVLAMQVHKCLQNLLCIHSNTILTNLSVFRAHLRDTLIHVLKIDAEHVVLNDLRIKILQNVPMLELLIPIYFSLHRLDFLLVQPSVRVHHFDHFDGKSQA